MKQFKISMVLLLIIGMTSSCGSSVSSSDNAEAEDSSKSANSQEVPAIMDENADYIGVKSKRLKIERDLNGHNTVLILNSPQIAKVGMSDFYLKVGDLPHKDITVSSVTKQGLVSKNKEDFYFGVKPTEGATEIDLNIIITEESGVRSNIGTLTLPIEN